MALIDYDKTGWVDDAAPDINAANLLNIERGIDRATKAVQVLESNPYSLPASTEANLGGVKIKVTDNGDGTYSGEIWV